MESSSDAVFAYMVHRDYWQFSQEKAGVTQGPKAHSSEWVTETNSVKI